MGRVCQDVWCLASGALLSANLGDTLVPLDFHSSRRRARQCEGGAEERRDGGGDLHIWFWLPDRKGQRT